jgi:hypothetical protein
MFGYQSATLNQIKIGLPFSNIPVAPRDVIDSIVTAKHRPVFIGLEASFADPVFLLGGPADILSDIREITPDRAKASNRLEAVFRHGGWWLTAGAVRVI